MSTRKTALAFAALLMSSMTAFDHLAAAAELSSTCFSEGKGCGAICLDGNYLYATQKNNLCVFDVSQPDAPRKIGETPAAGNRQMVKGGKYLYLSCRASGVQIFDVENPARPTLINHFFPVELATGLTLSGDVLGVTLRIYGVEFFNVKNPYEPHSMGLLRTAEAQSAAFFGDGKIAVGDWGAGKLVIGDCKDPSHPVILGQGALDGFGDGVAVQGHYAYASTGHHSKTIKGPDGEGLGHGLEIFDITNLAKPKKVGNVKFAKKGVVNCDWWSVVPVGDTAFCADTQNGLYVVDIADPTKPAILDHLLLPNNDCVSQIAVGDGVVYLSGRKAGLHLVKHGKAKPAVPPKSFVEPVIAAPVPPKVPNLRTKSAHGFVWNIAIDGDTLYASCGTDGLEIMDIAADGSLTTRRHLKCSCFDCVVHGDLLFLAKDTALEVLDKKTLTTIGHLAAETGYPFLQLHVWNNGKLLNSSSRTSHLQFVDIANPAEPKSISLETNGGILYGDMVPEDDINGMLPVNRHSSGLCWYKADNRPNLFFKKFPELKSQQRNGIALFGDRFLRICNGHAEILDPAEPGKPRNIPMPRICGIPTADGDTIAVSDRRDGIISMLHYDGEQLASIPERRYNLSFTITGRVVFHNHKAYIPAGLYGIYFE